MKRTKRLLTFLALLFASQLYAQKIEKADLYRTWHLDKYSDEEAYFQPPRKETKYYITFREDMTFEEKSEGEVGSGTWMLNTNGSYVETKSKAGETEKRYVYFLSEASLVVGYDDDRYRIWEVHYVAGEEKAEE